jgi:hypothetical protein
MFQYMNLLHPCYRSIQDVGLWGNKCAVISNGIVAKMGRFYPARLVQSSAPLKIRPGNSLPAASLLPVA